MSRLFSLCFLLAVGFATAGFTVYQGQPAPYSRTASGIEYRIYRLQNGRYTLRTDVSAAGDTAYARRVGQVLSANMQYRTGKDSVLFSSRKQLGMPLLMPLPEVKVRGGLEEALALLQPGDSATFRFQADSVFRKSFRQPVPAPVRAGGNVLVLLIKANKFLTAEEARAEQQRLLAEAKKQEAAAAVQRQAKDAAAIQAYATRNKLVLLKTAGGTHYVITKRGTGPKPTTGQTVSVLYKGALLSGKVFDSTEKNGGKPIAFPIGVGQVIPGWDQAIAQLPQGSKAILLIPSGLAYGARGAGPDIPPHAILRFDVELVEVK